MLDNIPRQKQVLQDIYNILSQIAVDVQPPENVSINTSNNIHTIQNFGYNLNPKHYGSYENAISLKIGVDYNIKNLTATVLTAHIGNIFPKIIREVDENTNKTTIDGIECKFYNNGICASPINKKETKCKNIPSEWCYFKQLLQLKEENKELKAKLENPERMTAKEFVTPLIEAECIECRAEFNAQLQAKDSELLSQEKVINRLIKQVDQQKEELEEIKKQFQIECLQDNTTGKRTYRSLTLIDVERERDELKTKVKYLHSFLKNRYNYGSFRPMWGAYLLKHLFNENLGDFFDEEAYKMADTIEEKEKQLSRHEQALIEIEDYVRDNCDFDKSDKLTSNTGAYDILKIISKAKDSE